MRRLETEARKTKEQLAIFKASGYAEGAGKSRTRLRAIKEKYNSIADRTGIKAQPEKMGVVGGTKGINTANNLN